jgi:predicted nucleic acid-binding Zn ribbon protein
MKTESDFTYRQNGDGSFDSICLDCFRTVCTAESIELLKAPEKQHVCEEDPRHIVNDSKQRQSRLTLMSSLHSRAH